MRLNNFEDLIYFRSDENIIFFTESVDSMYTPQFSVFFSITLFKNNSTMI